MEFAIFIKEPTNQPKNTIVLSQVIQFLIEHPKTEVNDAKFKKMIDFLNGLQGIEQIKPELLSKFLSENLDNDEILKLVKETLAKLDTLNVASSEAYELALNNKDFRTIVSSLEAEENSQKCVELAINLAKLDKLAAYEKLSGNKQWVNSFNQLVKHDGIKEVLIEKLSSEVVPKELQTILENPLLNALINKNVVIEADQVTKILNADNDLAKRLQTISETKTDEPRKKALYQLAIDLDKLGALKSFNQFEKEETQFLNVFHGLTVVPDGCDLHLMSEFPKEKKQYSKYSNSYLFIQEQKTLYYINALGKEEKVPIKNIRLFKALVELDLGKVNEDKLHLNNTDIKKIITSNGGHTLPDRAQLLKAMLTGYTPGLQILKLMAHSGEGVDLFRKYLAVTNKTDVNKNLYRLNRENLAPHITSLAIQLLFEKPDISDEAFKSSVAFLKTIQRSRKYGSDITSFLVATCDNKILLSETQATFKKLDEVGADTDYLYKTALETKETETAKKIREIVLDLPPISADKARDCGFFKMKNNPSTVGFNSSRYILTDNELLYYNHANKKLQTIELNPDQLKQLKSEFPSSIKKLSAEQFKKLTKIAPIHKHNIERCTLAEKLQKLRQLNRYDDYAKDNQLMFSFNKFTKHALMEKILEERHLERETILKNPRLNALIDAGICPTKYQQINQLLDETSAKSKAMDELLSLKSVDKTAYKWAFIDTPSGEAFRKVLSAIVKDEAIKPEDKPQMIRTLCALQLKNNKTFGLFLKPEIDKDKSKAINALLSFKLTDPIDYQLAFRNDDSGKAFRKVLTAIVADEKNIKPKDKPQMIQTLSSLLQKEKAPVELFLKLEPNGEESKAINALLSFKLTDPIDYQLAFLNDDSGKAFRKVLTAIVADEKNIKLKDKPQMIQTLSSLLQKEKAPVELFLKLKPESDKFKAINALLSLKLENPTAYEWTLSDNLIGHKFRKVLLAVVNDNENIKPENKPQMIQTLCSLQSKNNAIFDLFLKLTPNSDKSKAINALLLSLKLDDQKDYEWTFRDTTHGNEFRKACTLLSLTELSRKIRLKLK